MIDRHELTAKIRDIATRADWLARLADNTDNDCETIVDELLSMVESLDETAAWIDEQSA